MSKQSSDDFLQNKDFFDVKKDEPHLPGDGDTPFTPYDDPTSPAVNPQDPHTDYKSDIDETEEYNDGLEDASGTDDGDETIGRPTANRVG
ncbi:MAG TPA: hypothetical protein VLA77_00465 [Candidatus Saccharimonadales bacterium]|nr:hypothetical protein [Candidatus Saccharimonadales bacterium]